MNTTPEPESPQRDRAAVPELRDVARAQLLRIVAKRKGLSILVAFLVAQTISMAAFGIVFGVIVSTESENGAETTTYGWTRLSDFDLDAPLDEGTAALLFVTAATVIFGLFWSMRVWRGEAPATRGYHWAMPVDHRTHDLARVAAGAAWLIALVTALVATTLATAVIANTADRLASLGWTIWSTIFLAPLISYFLSMPAALRRGGPAGWVFGGLGVFGFGWSMATAFGLAPISAAIETIVISNLGILTTLARPLWADLNGLAPAPDSIVVLRLSGWLLLGLAATYLASKPRLP